MRLYEARLERMQNYSEQQRGNKPDMVVWWGRRRRDRDYNARSDDDETSIVFV